MPLENPMKLFGKPKCEKCHTNTAVSGGLCKDCSKQATIQPVFNREPKVAVPITETVQVGTLTDLRNKLKKIGEPLER